MSTTNVEKEVLVRSKAVVAAESAQDIDKIMPFWATDAIVQAAGTPQVQGHDAIAALYASFFEGGKLKVFEGTTTEIWASTSGDLACEYGTNRFVLSSPDGDLEDNGKYLAVWRKTDGEWYIQALSFTSDTPAPHPA